MRCDAARVGAIFRNLITNALKYNDKPRQWIAIGCVGPGWVGRSSRKLPSATAGASGWNPRLAEGSHFIGHWMPTMTCRHQPIPLVEDSPENYEATAPVFRRAGLANPLLHTIVQTACSTRCTNAGPMGPRQRRRALELFCQT
jgi:hypothetical protein